MLALLGALEKDLNPLRQEEKLGEVCGLLLHHGFQTVVGHFHHAQRDGELLKVILLGVLLEVEFACHARVECLPERLGAGYGAHGMSVDATARADTDVRTQVLNELGYVLTLDTAGGEWQAGLESLVSIAEGHCERLAELEVPVDYVRGFGVGGWDKWNVYTEHAWEDAEHEVRGYAGQRRDVVRATAVRVPEHDEFAFVG